MYLFFKHLIFLTVLLFFLPQRKEKQQYIIQGFAQGTDYTIKYFATDSLVTKAAIDSILLKIDSSMSLYKPYSEICRFNSSVHGLKIDKHFAAVIRKSFEIYKATAGKFDVTVKPLVQAWGFGPQPISDFPDSTTILSLLQCTGMRHLKLSGQFLHKNKSCTQVDLNGIAQGYSVDVVANHLLKNSINSFIVEIGGELRIEGFRPDGKLFKIGIEGPADTDHTEPSVKHVISLSSGAITTSGNYRKFLQQGSRKISHLIDAKTGYPLQNEMISVTLYAKDAITADGYDNAVMAMHVDEALNFARSKKLEAYIIYHDREGKVKDIMTAGFRKMIVDE
ncbi:FAD:protein FMN transferase [Pedobacter sp. PWIIR3]